jgi:hypothetical protein
MAHQSGGWLFHKISLMVKDGDRCPDEKFVHS